MFIKKEFIWKRLEMFLKDILKIVKYKGPFVICEYNSFELDVYNFYSYKIIFVGGKFKYVQLRV